MDHDVKLDRPEFTYSAPEVHIWQETHRGGLSINEAQTEKKKF